MALVCAFVEEQRRDAYYRNDPTKNTSLFNDISKSDMFFPQGLSLSKKERLSLIWLAANYDPEKYKKIVPARDCEGANIARICHAIMNPTYPYALRLSAQLLLGTVRVYRAKAKLLLELAEQMMLKLSTLIKEANIRNYDLPVSTMRTDAITLAVTGMGMIDYSLEPVYYDPQMIMHLNEGDFITMNGTPMQSPVKVEKPGKDSASKLLKSPLQVSNRKISIQEDLLSPNRPIQLPGEDELAFGPAQDDFLNDLNLLDIADFRLDEPERLEPVFEEGDEEIPYMGRESTKRKAEDVLENDFQIIRDDGKTELFIDDEPLMNLDEILKATKNLLNDFTDQATVGTSSEEEKLETVEKTHFPTTNVDRTATWAQQDWEGNLDTPADAIILKPTPSNPKKKRKLQVDKNMILEGSDMRHNLATPETTVRNPIIAGTAMATGKALFKIPMVSEFKRKHSLREWWDSNTHVPMRPQYEENFSLYHELPYQSETTSDDDILGAGVNLPSRNPDASKKMDETPASIDIPRAGEASMQSFERSGATLHSVNQTPVEDGLLKSINFDEPFDIALEPKQSPRISGIGVLPEHIEVDFYDAPELEPVREIDETLTVENVVENDFGQHDISQHFQAYQRHITKLLNLTNQTTFQNMFPSSRTRRKDAALAFYATLNLHKSGYLRLEQNELFGVISITRVNVQ